MSLPANGSGGTDPNTTGGPTGNDPNPTTPDPKPGDKVDYSTYQKVLDEKKRRDAELADLKRKLDEKDAEARRLAAEQATAAQDWKKLAELREQEAVEAKAKLQEATSTLTKRDEQERNAVRLEAFLDTVGGKVDRKYWGLIPIDQIVIDQTTGEPDKSSVARVVETFRQTHPVLIEPVSTPGTPNTAPRGGTTKPGAITYAEWLKLPHKEMAKRRADVID